MRFRSGWRLFGLAGAILSLWVPAAGWSATPGPAYPRLANIYLHGAVKAEAIPALARWDVVVLSSVWTNEQLAELRRLNPDILIYFYFCAYAMQDPPSPPTSWQKANYEYAAANDLWWRNADRTIASDWPGAKLVNITDRAPSGPAGPWRTWYARRIDELVAVRPNLDGVFLDNFWKSISWEQGKIIRVDSDCNPTHNPGGCNGVADSPALLDSLWNRALRSFARDLRLRFDVTQSRRSDKRPLAILTNGASDYFSWINGTTYERFPSGNTPVDLGAPYEYNWNYEMFNYPSGYVVAPVSPKPYPVQIVNASWRGSWSAPERSQEFERHKRFTLGSTLLGDGYYSLDSAETEGHGHLWWEPEYDGGGIGPGYLGYPLGPAQRIGVPAREEFVLNGSFATTKLPWEALATACDGEFRLDSAVLRSSPCSARLTVTSLAPGGSLRLTQNVPVLAGFPYTISFYARATPAQPILMHLYSDACPGGRCIPDQRFWVTPEWRQFAFSFVAPGNTQAGLNLFVTTPGSVWVDDVSLRMGNTSVFRRDFDRGVVLLNYTEKPQIVDLGGTFYRLRVPGSSVWDGALLTAEIVPPGDARILLRHPPPTDAPPEEPPAGSPHGRLLEAVPNPMGLGTTIRFALGRDELVRLVIYDVAGRRIRTLLDAPMRAGAENAVPWDATDDAGRRVAPGIYLCRIETPTLVESRKLTVSR